MLPQHLTKCGVERRDRNDSRSQVMSRVQVTKDPKSWIRKIWRLAGVRDPPNDTTVYDEHFISATNVCWKKAWKL